MPNMSLDHTSKYEDDLSSGWTAILAFIVLVNAVGWLACLLLRSTFAGGLCGHSLHSCSSRYGRPL
jgi:hypothetical protein